MKKQLSALSCFVFALWLSSPLNANLVAQELLSLKQLVALSNRIVIGKVVGIEAQWDEARTRIWTYVRLRSEKFLKAPSFQSEVTIRVMGGELNGLGLAVSHAPTFQEGERVLVFLQENDRGVFDVVGWVQGKYTFKNDRLERMGGEEPLTFVDQVKNVVNSEIGRQ